MKNENLKISLGFWSVIFGIGILAPSPGKIDAASKIQKDKKNVVDSSLNGQNNKNLTKKVFKYNNKKNKTNRNKIKKYIKVSQKGLNFIKESESLSLTSYRIKGETSNTIGYGHKINSEDPLWLRQKYVGYSITKNEAEKIFNKDIEEKIEPALNSMYKELDSLNVSVELLNQDFWDGMASLIYNCGYIGIKNSNFYHLLKRNRIHMAIQKISETHIYKSGHKLRRNKEQEMMSLD